jgi:hypothetical protein
VGNATSYKKSNNSIVHKARIPSIERTSYFFCQKEKEMRKKGETGVQDRTKPQPMQKKVREETRKKKKLARLERQRSR